ncbi:DMT family transporter [Actinotalea sp. AC32]|nr:DMT family transporter [Actinotalea sp. AC32]
MTATTAPAPPTAAPLRSWFPGFLLAGLIWGCSFAFIAVGLRALTPVQVAFWRLLLGATALMLMSVVMRVRLPSDRRTWGHLVVVAVLLNAAPGVLFAIGQQHVSSVIAGIINAMTPLATLAVILAAYPEERPTARRVVGLLTGFAGVAVVIGVWRGLGSGQWSGILACLAAITCYGLALPYSRRYLTSTGQRPLGLVTGQVALSAVLMLPVVLLTGIAPHGDVTPTVVGAMLALGALGSGVAYALNFHVIAVAGPGTASTVTYLSPVVAAVVGVAFLGEHLSWNEPVGALVIFAGVAIAQAKARAPRPPRVPAPS